MAVEFQTALEQAISGKAVSIATGRPVFRQGDQVRWLYRVSKGRVRLSRVLARGTEIVLARVTAGDVLAEASVFSSRYHCNATAETPCEFLRYAMKDVLALMAAQPQAAIAYSAYLAHELMDLRTTVEVRAIRRADERLLTWLRLRASGSPAVFDGAGVWPSIAKQIGLSGESLYRALSSLERSGRLKRHRGRVTLTSR